MAELLERLDGLLQSETLAKLPANIKAFLIKENLLDVDDIALLSSVESKVDGAFIAPLVAGNIKCDLLAEKVAVRKLWALCRGIYDKKKDANGGCLDVTDEPLPAEVQVSIDTKWLSKHAFVLGTHRLLTTGLLDSLYRHVHASPRSIPVLLFEALRTQSCTVGHGRKATQLNVQPGRSVTAEEVIADDVAGHFELWVRVRALFTSLAYVSIDLKDFFPYQECETFCDTILELINKRYKGQRPPLEFFKSAYIGTIQVFSEAVRVRKCTLAHIVTSRSEWQYF